MHYRDKVWGMDRETGWESLLPPSELSGIDARGPWIRQGDAIKCEAGQEGARLIFGSPGLSEDRRWLALGACSLLRCARHRRTSRFLEGSTLPNKGNVAGRLLESNALAAQPPQSEGQ